MIINWKGQGLLMVPIIEDENVRTLGGVPQVGGEQQVRILPGYNDVPDEVWFKIRVHLKDHILNGKLEEFVVTKKDEATGELIERGASLRRQTVPKAREIVINCFNVDSLVLWLKGSETMEMEERADIRVLIDEQIKSINQGRPTQMIEEIRRTVEAGRK